MFDEFVLWRASPAPRQVATTSGRQMETAAGIPAGLHRGQTHRRVGTELTGRPLDDRRLLTPFCVGHKNRSAAFVNAGCGSSLTASDDCWNRHDSEPRRHCIHDTAGLNEIACLPESFSLR